jgi:hypothetical protein
MKNREKQKKINTSYNATEQRKHLFIYLFLIFILLICTYNVWVISPPCSLPSPTVSLATQQKLFCPYQQRKHLLVWAHFWVYTLPHRNLDIEVYIHTCVDTYTHSDSSLLRTQDHALYRTWYLTLLMLHNISLLCYAKFLVRIIFDCCIIFCSFFFKVKNTQADSYLLQH